MDVDAVAVDEKIAGPGRPLFETQFQRCLGSLTDRLNMRVGGHAVNTEKLGHIAIGYAAVEIELHRGFLVLHITQGRLAERFPASRTEPTDEAKTSAIRKASTTNLK